MDPDEGVEDLAGWGRLCGALILGRPGGADMCNWGWFVPGLPGRRRTGGKEVLAERRVGPPLTAGNLLADLPLDRLGGGVGSGLSLMPVLSSPL